MTVYLLLAAAAAIFGFLFCEGRNSKRRDQIFVAVSAVVLVLIAAVRKETVGIDIQVYNNYFQEVCSNDFAWIFSSANKYRNEIGYCLLNFIVSRATQNSAVWMGIVSGTIILLRCIAIYRLSVSKWLSIFIYIAFGFFGYALCTLRQELGISIALFAIPFLMEKKIIPYMAIVAAAGLFHNSLFVLVPVYFFVRLPFHWKTAVFFISVIVFILLFSDYILAWITQYVYKAYQPGSYYLRGRDLRTAFIPVAFFILCVLFRKQLIEKDKKNEIYLFLYGYGAFFMILTIKHFVFQRIGLIFLPTAIFLFPELLQSIKPKESKAEQQERLKNASRTKRKNGSSEYLELKNKFTSQMTIYYTSLGLFIFFGFVYFLFLLSANRLALVPYLFR